MKETAVVTLLLTVCAAALIVAGVATWSPGAALTVAGVALLAIAERFEFDLVDDEGPK